MVLTTNVLDFLQGKAREAEVERINARTIEDDMAEASLEELDELEDELADDGMLEKYRCHRNVRRLVATPRWAISHNTCQRQLRSCSGSRTDMA